MEETFYHSMSSVPLEKVVQKEYRNYQIYTLMDRAIPYLQDGLKPCQRRILFTLWKHSQKGFIKVSAATGLVLTLHPHGPPSIESSIVNMAQDFTFSNNYPLIDKKGYFGERMETAPAASRYIECKLGVVSKLLLFDDMNQIEMIPNYDEKILEPSGLLPKLPIMLLNGSEGIGTGFSSVIPSFNHRDIIASMISVVKVGRPKKLRPWIRNFSDELSFDEKGKIITSIKYTEKNGKIYIIELPRGYDAKRIYKFLGKYIEKDYLKDFIDSSVDNQINIELIFKRGQTPTLEDVEQNMPLMSSIVPNYTLISERGVKVLKTAEDIIKIFTLKRIEVVKRRYELLAKDSQEKLILNNEIIRFIEEKHYTMAQKANNRKSFIEYLSKKEFVNSEYLVDMSIYRLTKEEVQKRKVLIKEHKEKLKEYKKIFNSEELVKDKLIEELVEVRDKITEIFKKREKERDLLYRKLDKQPKKKKK